MRDTYRLIRPKLWIVRNNVTRPARLDRFKTFFFSTLSLLFFLGLLYASVAFFQKLAAEEPFGMILVHKLVEFLFLTFFTVLVFSGIVTSLNAFFLDSDLPLVITAPMGYGHIYVARFLQALVLTGWMVVLFGLPVFIACGIVFQASAVFYPWMLLTLIAFVVFPVSVGSLVTLILVRAFPARKLQDVLVLLAILFVIALYFLFRFLRPEQLFNPDIFHGFAEYFATLRSPNSPLLPSTWASLALLAPLEGKLTTDGLFFVLQMLAWGMFAAFLGSQLANRTYLDAFTKSQEGRRLRMTGTPAAQKLFSVLSFTRDGVARQFFLKEIRGFFRDTSQWTQLLLLLALIVVYLFNFKALDLDRFAGITWNLRNTLAYVNLGLAGFVLSAICVRFVLPAVSLEGKAFWIVRSAPVSIKQFMWTKFRFYALPVVVVSEMLILMSNFYLGSSFFMTAVCAWVMGMLSVGITGLAVGIGAMYPNFEEKNVARMASGVSSIIYMSISAGLIVAVVGTMAYPVKLLQRMMRTGSPLVGAQWAIVGLSIVIVLSMIAASVLYPMRKGIESLDQREL